MMQFIFDTAVRAATVLIITVGSLGALTLLVAAMWKLADYLFRSTKSVALIIEYARNRKAFQKWREQKPKINAYNPKIKE